MPFFGLTSCPFFGSDFVPIFFRDWMCESDLSFDGYCSTVQDVLDWFEVDSGFTELCLFR